MGCLVRLSGKERKGRISGLGHRPCASQEWRGGTEERPLGLIRYAFRRLIAIPNRATLLTSKMSISQQAANRTLIASICDEVSRCSGGRHRS